jgi:PLP dependent protein
MSMVFDRQNQVRGIMNTSVENFQAPSSGRAQVLAQRRQSVLQQIHAACAIAQRSVSEVTLLAVSKTFPGSDVRALHAAGQRCFGENYVQEGCAKVAELADLKPDIEWHMIGPLQSNKTRDVAAHFDWVHTVDRLKIAQRLSEQRPADCADLNVLIQVNIDGAPSKSGLLASEALQAAQAIQSLPRLRVRGLMVMPDAGEGVAAHFAQAQRLFAQIGAALQHPSGWDTLSMGMSGDMEAAVAQGSTLLRIGSALFGSRS